MSKNSVFETKYRKYKMKYLTLQDSHDYQNENLNLGENFDDFKNTLKNTKKIIDNPGELLKKMTIDMKNELGSLNSEYREIYEQYINIFEDYDKSQENVSSAKKDCLTQNNILEIFRRIEPDLKLKGIDFDLVNSYQEFTEKNFDDNLDSITDFLLSNDAYVICLDNEPKKLKDDTHKITESNDIKKIPDHERTSSMYEIDGGAKNKYNYKNPPTTKDIRKLYKSKKVIPQQVYIPNDFKASIAFITMINQILNQCETVVISEISEIKEKGHKFVTEIKEKGHEIVTGTKERGSRIASTIKQKGEIGMDMIGKTATSTNEMYDLIHKSNRNVYSKIFEIVITSILVKYAKTTTEFGTLLINSKNLKAFKKVIFSYVIPTAIVATAVFSCKYFSISRRSVLSDTTDIVAKVDSLGLIFGQNNFFDTLALWLGGIIVTKLSTYLYTQITKLINEENVSDLLIGQSFESSAIVVAHGSVMHQKPGFGEIVGLSCALYNLYHYNKFLTMLMNESELNDTFNNYSHKSFIENMNFINPELFLKYNKKSRDLLLTKLQSDTPLTTYLKNNGYDLDLLYEQLDK